MTFFSLFLGVQSESHKLRNTLYKYITSRIISLVFRRSSRSLSPWKFVGVTLANCRYVGMRVAARGSHEREGKSWSWGEDRVPRAWNCRDPATTRDDASSLPGICRDRGGSGSSSVYRSSSLNSFHAWVYAPEFLDARFWDTRPGMRRHSRGKRRW